MTKTPYKLDDKLFLYDEETAIVYYVAKMSKEDKKENEEWKAEHGKPLFETDPTGNYMLLDGVGLGRENWKDKDARDGYLSIWSDEIDEETAYLMDDLKAEFGL